ncbi:MAG TPA: inositol monophosphatase family protein [Frankiaceae bacterium]|nr:inositol monophosphatase family protein [Frankiaceae bacterium]
MSTELRTLAERLATDAGALLLERLPYVRTVASKSTPTDVVSEVDKASEALIVAALRRERPDDAILAEEGTYDTGTTGLRWVVDPLDGTVNYLYRGAAFCTSVGVEDASGGVAGAVCDPQRGELFSALRGEGATLGGEPLRANDVTDLSQALVATGFSYAAADRAWQGRVLAEVLPHVRDIRRGGSCALDLCSVAAGRVDAYYELGPAPWDVCAGFVVAAEAGAVVHVGKAPDGRDLTVVAAPGIADALLELLRDAGAFG